MSRKWKKNWAIKNGHPSSFHINAYKFVMMKKLFWFIGQRRRLKNFCRQSPYGSSGKSPGKASHFTTISHNSKKFVALSCNQSHSQIHTNASLFSSIQFRSITFHRCQTSNELKTRFTKSNLIDESDQLWKIPNKLMNSSRWQEVRENLYEILFIDFAGEVSGKKEKGTPEKNLDDVKEREKSFIKLNPVRVSSRSLLISSRRCCCMRER